VETLELGARLRTTAPEVQVDPRLPAGRYVVSLTVTSERGESRVATLQFTVQEGRSAARLAGGANTATRRPR
jgi:methionine-rich copper-binding protein CopC